MYVSCGVFRVQDSLLQSSKCSLHDVYVAMEMNLKDSKQDIISTPLQ